MDMTDVVTRFKTERPDEEAHFERLRLLPCCVPGCDSFQSIVHHERRGTGGGTALKPPAWSAVNLCQRHHVMGHAIGWKTFEKRFGIDLKTIAKGHALVSRGMGLLPREEQS
jgi:hypothetical protein